MILLRKFVVFSGKAILIHPIGFCNNCCNKPYILFYENICQMNTYQENYGKPKQPTIYLIDMGEGGGFACPENTK